MPGIPNYYALFQIPGDASVEEVRRAYHELARKLHPDINRDIDAHDQFLQIKEGFEILSDRKKRIAYDLKLQEENHNPIIVRTSYSRSCLITLPEAQIIYVLLDFTVSPEMVEKAAPPLNLCLVLDRSTSMQGARLNTVKSAAIELTRQMRPVDIVSIVSFSDRAEVVIPSGKRPTQHYIETQVQMIKAGGGTEIFQGMETGFHEVMRNLSSSSINHIILITDGHTYGDEEACLQLADRAAARGIRITSLGIGTEWNDNFIDNLTSRTGGSAFYIARASDIKTFIQEKYISLNQIVAEYVTLKVATENNVVLQSLFRLQPDACLLPLSNQIHLGSVQKNIDLAILLEFNIAPTFEEKNRFLLAQGEVNFVLPYQPALTQRIPVSFSRSMGTPEQEEKPATAIFQALTRLSIFRMQEKARQEVSEGKVEAASVRLQQMATRLISLGEMELAHITMTEADRIQKTHMLSAEGEKSIKYGTRSFLLPSQATARNTL
jgi:Ca-activated chloride channel family protein